MRTLIWWIRSAFCKHDWKLEESKWNVHHLDIDFVETNVNVSATCNKCGWHRSYKKYGRL